MKKTDYLVIQAPMVSTLKLSGYHLLVFALIHGFTKDGEQRYRATVDDFIRWTGGSERTIKGVIANLLDNGFISREQVTYKNRKAFEYWSNYEELLDASSKGDDVRLVKRRGAKIAPLAKVQKLHGEGAKTAPLGVQKLHGEGAKIAPVGLYKEVAKYSFNYSDNYFYQQLGDQIAPVSEQEKEEFFKIFFCKNAANPAAEVDRFLARNTSLAWKDRAGNAFDTPNKRAGLADMWTDFHTGTGRLKAEFGTEEEKAEKAESNNAFLSMLGELYELASSTPVPPVIPKDLLVLEARPVVAWSADRSSMMLKWVNGGAAEDWWRSGDQAMRDVIRKHFPKINRIMFANA